MTQLSLHPQLADDQIAARQHALFDPAGPTPMFTADFRLRQYWMNGRLTPEAEALAHSRVPANAWRADGIEVQPRTDLTWPAQALGSPDFSTGVRIEIEASQVHADRDFPTLIALGDNAGNVIDIHSFGDGAGLRARCRINGENTVFLSQPYPDGVMFRAVLEIGAFGARLQLNENISLQTGNILWPALLVTRIGRRDDETNSWQGNIQFVSIGRLEDNH